MIQAHKKSEAKTIGCIVKLGETRYSTHWLIHYSSTLRHIENMKFNFNPKPLRKIWQCARAVAFLHERQGNNLGVG